MKNLLTLNLLPVLALASFFINIKGSVSLRPVLNGPAMAFLGTRVIFRCSAPDSSPPVNYELLVNGSFFMATDSDLTGDQPATFALKKVTASSEGSYQCKVMAGGNTGVSNTIKLSAVTPPSNARVTSDPFPPVMHEGSRLILSCNAKGSHLSYTWFFNRREATSSTSPTFHFTKNKLVIEKVTEEHAGYYYCTVRSRVQDTERFTSSRPEVQVTVKAYISKPRIAFSISKEGTSYSGNVTCWSTRGSPPANFSLSLDDRAVGTFTATESLTAWFPVDMVPGLDMGVAQCRVNTEVQELMSEPVTLVVVPVGGDVKVEVEYLYRADSEIAAARLRCQVSRGTFPYVSWLLNASILIPETHMDTHVRSYHALADHRRTLIVANLGPEESGYYRCRVRNSYDDSEPWMESKDLLVQDTDRTTNSMPPATPSTETEQRALMTTIEIITIVFCCFVLLTLAVCTGLVYKMFDHEQEHTRFASTNPSSDVFHLSAPMSHSEDKQSDTSSTDYNALDQTAETAITV